MISQWPICFLYLCSILIFSSFLISGFFVVFKFVPHALNFCRLSYVELVSFFLPGHVSRKIFFPEEVNAIFVIFFIVPDQRIFVYFKATYNCFSPAIRNVPNSVVYYLAIHLHICTNVFCP